MVAIRPPSPARHQKIRTPALIASAELLAYPAYVNEWLARLPDKKGRFLWTAWPWSDNWALTKMSKRAQQQREEKRRSPDVVEVKRSFLHRERVGVVAFRERGDPDLEPFAEQDLGRLARGVLARRVAVVQRDDLVRKPLQDPCMAKRKRGWCVIYRPRDFRALRWRSIPLRLLPFR